MKDGLAKFKDLPTELGGSGDVLGQDWDELGDPRVLNRLNRALFSFVTGAFGVRRPNTFQQWTSLRKWLLLMLSPSSGKVRDTRIWALSFPLQGGSAVC